MYNKTKRPKFEIQPDSVDRLIELIGFIGVIVLLGLPILYYGNLPDIIPGHFNIHGEPDAYSGKGIIWILPVAGLVMFIGMSVLVKFPHIFNYPVTITPENAERQYILATKVIRILSASLIWLFCYIIYVVIRISLGDPVGLKLYLILVFVGFIFVMFGVYLYKSIKAK
ncbi:DUF1648 domain-containing protein [candidate division KSB1 bacterium]|nr:DUF1648 domain-containing protein [candidate division KSB1 bacterium]